MKTLLIMTVGQTDVQFVDQGKKREFAKGKVGALHDKLRDRLGSWKLVDAPHARGESLEALPAGQEWKICTPKLDAVLAYFGEAPPDAVLLLETTRNIRGDPRFAGRILQMRANSLGIQDVRCCAYLGPGDENLEDRDSPLDAIVRRDVVRRIYESIQNATSKATRIVVATVGGMPEVKNLVKEVARLHAPAGVVPDEIEVDDGARNNGQPDRAVSRKRVDPIEPIRLRKQALSLIEKGNLLGAWGAVSHLEDVPGQEWTKVIKCLALFASSLPLPENCDLAVLSHKRMAVRAALRVEFALRAGDIPRAIHGTVAFFESALWDKLLEHFERHPSSRQSRYYKIKNGSPPIDEKLIRKGDCSRDDQNRPFKIDETEDGVTCYNIFDNDVCAVRIAEHYLKSCHLKRLGQAVSKVRDLRNDVAHNEPTSALIKNARGRIVKAKLWSEDKDGIRFLSVDLVQNVLAELGEHNAENLYVGLMATVRERLLALPAGAK